MDEESARTGMNYTLLATPAEGLSGRFVKLDRARYGSIEGVTDREYYTNSFHIPVYYPINAARKIQLEAPYHELTNAGHITYVELDGDPLQNLDAFEKIVRVMHDAGIGYGSINHPVDRDPVCGFNGIIGDKCPQCGREEDDMPFERIRRITGYCGHAGSVQRRQARRGARPRQARHLIKGECVFSAYEGLRRSRRLDSGWTGFRLAVFAQGCRTAVRVATIPSRMRRTAARCAIPTR